MELTDEELEVLHELLTEAVTYGNPGIFDNEDAETLSAISEKARAEAKRRGFWWAR